MASSMKLPEGMNESGGVTASIVYLKEAANCYEKADMGSKIVANLEKGRQMLKVAEVDDEWCQVITDGQKMYVQTKYIGEAMEESELAEEMQQLKTMRAAEAENDVRTRKKVMRDRMTGILIAVLIAGIFIAGIVNVVRSGDKEGGKSQR